MLKNYLRVTFRNLIRHRLYTLINVLGLAVGVRGVRGVLLALVVAMATTSTQFRYRWYPSSVVGWHGSAT